MTNDQTVKKIRSFCKHIVGDAHSTPNKYAMKKCCKLVRQVPVLCDQPTLNLEIMDKRSTLIYEYGRIKTFR